MPQCFQLSRKSSKEFTPVAFNEIDEELCKAFGVPVHPDRYFREWYGTIGFALACGHDWQAIKEKQLGDPTVVDWLAMHYDFNAFYMSK